MPAVSSAQTIALDSSEVRPGPVAVTSTATSVMVTWPDETSRTWTATFSLEPNRPLITSIGVGATPVITEARAFYRGETGKRRGGWNVFFDDPTTHPEGTRHVQATFALRGAKARTLGERVEVVFDGMQMGGFAGALSYTFYPGSRLIHQEAVLTTNDPDVAYYYDAGLDMAAPADRTPGNNMRSEIAYYDTSGTLKKVYSTGFRAEREPVQVRHRTLAAKTAGGSVAAFPAPHQYFFPRDFSSNLAYLWHRSWRGRVGLGVRQLRDENWQYYPWVNAPPGRAQRMGVFFLVSDGTPEATLAHVLRYTNRDRFVALPGYKTLSTHWHLADTVQAIANGPKWTPPFKPVLKAMGVDASMIMDFHGDGHPGDLTELRLDEIDAYYKTLKAQSDPDFLLIPAEEANVHLGGHWSVVFPKPVYWWMNRPKDANAAFEMKHPKYGKVYSTANAQEMLDLVRREGGYMYQTHARTKGSTGFPDKIVSTEHFRDPRYLGAGWKAMPSDLSSPRLGDRVFDLLDDLSNQGLRKRIFGEVDMFQFDHTDELYAHMNINYIKLDRLPAFDQYALAVEPLARGEFFTTTGEVLLPRVDLTKSTANEVIASVDAQWTFPLRFAEIVWSDGKTTHRETIPLGDAREFGKRTFEWRAAATGWQWARVAVWDVAGNGAFVNPTWKN